MAYLTRDDIPFHYALADAFTVCDAYHCSFIGATDPNRYYMLSGHVGNDGKGGGPVLGNQEPGYGWTTYAERLEQAGVSWKVYQDIGDGLDAAGNWGWIDDAYRGNYGDNSLLYFNKYRNAKPGDPLYDKARTGTNAKAGDGYFDLLKADVKAGKLPQVSWIAAPEAFTEHPNWPVELRRLVHLAGPGRAHLQPRGVEQDRPVHHVRRERRLLRPRRPAVRPRRPPRRACPPWTPRSTTSRATRTYAAGHYGLGQRVPMIVVSPWSTGGFVNSEVFDHTSIIRFMEQRFGVQEPNISPWRRAVCGDLTSAFDFGRQGHRPGDAARTPTATSRRTTTGTPTTCPRPPANAAPAQAGAGLPARAPAAVRPAGGRRRRRPRPASSRSPSAAAPRRARASTSGRGNRTDGPWTYTTEAGKKLSDTWNTDVLQGRVRPVGVRPERLPARLQGPRQDGGPRGDRPPRQGERQPQADPEERAAAPTANLTVTNAYGGAAETFKVKAGGTVEHTVDLRASKRWYDVTVKSDADAVPAPPRGPCRERRGGRQRPRDRLGLT